LPFSSFIAAHFAKNSAGQYHVTAFSAFQIAPEIVATGPRPLSSRDSITTPFAAVVVPEPFSSSTSACKKYAFQQAINAPWPVLADTSSEHRVAAPIFRNDIVRNQFVPDPFNIGFRFVDFIDGHNDRDFGRFGMVNGFDGLRHDAIIRGHDQE
jgi:hypothetical protein